MVSNVPVKVSFYSEKKTEQARREMVVQSLDVSSIVQISCRHFYSWISTSFGENLCSNCHSLNIHEGR